MEIFDGNWRQNIRLRSTFDSYVSLQRSHKCMRRRRTIFGKSEKRRKPKSSRIRTGSHFVKRTTHLSKCRCLLTFLRSCAVHRCTFRPNRNALMINISNSKAMHRSSSVHNWEIIQRNVLFYMFNAHYLIKYHWIGKFVSAVCIGRAITSGEKKKQIVDTVHRLRLSHFNVVMNSFHILDHNESNRT